MKLQIDTRAGTLAVLHDDGRSQDLPLYSDEGLRLVSGVWLKQEWNQLHWQSFSWFGLPIWQLPEDLLRLQEVLVQLQPDLIIETGINRGGSTLFFASLCRLLGRGRVISVDISIPAELRQRIDASPFAELITLVEGDSTASGTVQRVHELAAGAQRVFVFLDSDHSCAHVRRELDAYAELVSPGSWIVATDGVMQDLADTPWGRPEWVEDNPAAAAREFAADDPRFVIHRPPALYGEEHVVPELTYWPDAWLQRIGD
jgi:cephalosporin hydroxylase